MTGFCKTVQRPAAMSGAALVYAQTWQVPAPPRPLRLARALQVLLSPEGVVALEGTRIDPEVKRVLRPFAVAPAIDIPGGTFRRPQQIHIRATEPALTTLTALANSVAPSQMCDVLYAYEEGALLLEWHESFGDPIHVADTIPPELVHAFCVALGV